MHEKKNKVLIVDDEAQIRKMLHILLEASDYKIEESEKGKEAIRLVASIKPDLILLDLGLPDIDGKEAVRAIREWSQVPIIVLSIRSDDNEVAECLDLGADDYITKPFSSEVLLARIRANLRKSAVKEAGEPSISNGYIDVDLVRHEVFIKGEKIPFTPKEYELLRYFIINRGKMLTHKQILKDVWGQAQGESTQYLRVYVGQIREKIQDSVDDPKLIITEPGIGYRMEVQESLSKSEKKAAVL